MESKRPHDEPNAISVGYRRALETPGRLQCTAKSKRSGERCQRFPIVGRTTCYMHGGTQPVGPAANNYKDGRYSKYLPTKYLPAYQAAQSDPDLLSLQHEIRLTDTMLSKLLETLDDVPSDVRWKELGEALRRRRIAQAKGVGGQAEFEGALFEMDRLIEEGIDQANTKTAVGRQLMMRARLVEAETKRIKLAQDTLAGEQAMGFVVALSNIVKTHVTDPRTLAKISADIARLLDRH